MRHFLTLLVSLVMITTLSACPDKGKGGGAVAVAPPPTPPTDRGGCKYDFQQQRYRYDNGDSCSYDDFYDPNGCYNYFYDVRYGRYYNEYGDPVDNCSNEYIDYQYVIPYYNYNYTLNYAYWGCPNGYVKVPVGFGYYVCSVDPYSNPSLNLTWWFWLNL